jgi:nitrate reductase (NAD(P)H)
VELSLDGGSTWELAHITYPEDFFREIVHSDPIYGRLDMSEIDTCFCWCFWNFTLDVGNLATRELIVVRCMDESLALQPRDMYWNATGMMNNW